MTFDHKLHQRLTRWSCAKFSGYALEYQEISQDVAEIMLRASRTYRAAEGCSFSSYAARFIPIKVGQKLARSRSPVTCKSNQRVREICQLKPVDVDHASDYAEAFTPEEYTCVVRLRKRLSLVAGDEEALRVALGYTDPKDVARSKDEAKQMYIRVRKVKRRIAKDKHLREMFYESIKS